MHSLDALFSGITTAVTETLPNPGSPVNPLSNYFFNVASSIVLILLAGFIIDKILEPRLRRQDVPTEEIADDEAQIPGALPSTTLPSTALSSTLTSVERRGVIRAVVAGAVVAAVILTGVLLPDSPWRNEDGGYLPKSPLLSSIVFIVFIMFTVPGLVYGKITGTIASGKDVPRVMGSSIKDMSGFLVLAFILGQFIALFNWSGIGNWLAVAGASGLESIGLTGYPAIIGFILLASLLNLFIISGSAMWTLMASVFVPMFALLGFEPAFIQGAFRVGDSATQILTPLNPYMIVLLTMLRKYEPQAGLGTVIARMLPFTVLFWLAWVGVLTVFFVFGLPMGPGNGIYIDG
ncbi:AbgT family transporter [Arthrobacter sp. ZGTC212]|uniref:AbgT family transporter n=1 Tax=Arthrobacter sp. ZGTC212 TaxID=2058899 RepID=UPI0028006D58|nr:AbgT family transporter [Arthrobacter sp. ZGTC212]